MSHTRADGTCQPTIDIFVADAQPWDLLDPASPKHPQYMPRG
jgi:hypothetical protein